MACLGTRLFVPVVQPSAHCKGLVAVDNHGADYASDSQGFGGTAPEGHLHAQYCVRLFNVISSDASQLVLQVLLPLTVLQEILDFGHFREVVWHLESLHIVDDFCDFLQSTSA